MGASVASNGSTAWPGSFVTAVTSPSVSPATGQPIVILMYEDQNLSSATTFSVTDTCGTHFTWAVAISDFGYAHDTLYGGPTVALIVGTGGAGTGTVTITASQSSNWALEILTCAGASSGSGLAIVGATGSTYNKSGTTLGGASLTPSSPGDLLVWGVCVSAVNNYTANTEPASPFVNDNSLDVFTGRHAITSWYANAPSVESPTWAWTGARQLLSVGAVIKQASNPTPTRPTVYSQAVQRAANWMKRESGLWSPESGLIPRAA